MRLTPSLTDASAVHWACRSVGMPGYGSATTSTARSRRSAEIDTQSGPTSIFAPASCKFRQHRVKMLRHHADDRGRAAGDGRGDQQRGGLDAVGNQPVRCAAELLDPLDADRGRSEPFDSRPHRDEEAAEIDDFRLDGRAADRGRAAGKHGGAHHVGRAGDRGTARAGKVDACAGQSPGGSHDVAVIQADVGPEGRQAFQVQIDGPHADVASAGQRHHGAAAPCQQRTEHAEARPHPPHQSFLRSNRERNRSSRWSAQVGQTCATACSQAVPDDGECPALLLRSSGTRSPASLSDCRSATRRPRPCSTAD